MVWLPFWDASGNVYLWDTSTREMIKALNVGQTRVDALSAAVVTPLQSLPVLGQTSTTPLTGERGGPREDAEQLPRRGYETLPVGAL